MESNHQTTWTSLWLALAVAVSFGAGCSDEASGGAVTLGETTSNGTTVSSNSTSNATTGTECSNGVCSGGMVCDEGQCVDACTTQTNACTGEEVCNPDTGLCIDSCGSDDGCGTAEICDTDSGLCVDEQCSEEGVQGMCSSGEVCADGRCLPEQDPAVRAMFVAGLCAGCGQMQSSRYKATVVLAPVEIIDQPAASGRFRLESGTLSIIRED